MTLTSLKKTIKLSLWTLTPIRLFRSSTPWWVAWPVTWSRPLIRGLLASRNRCLTISLNRSPTWRTRAMLSLLGLRRPSLSKAGLSSFRSQQPRHWVRTKNQTISQWGSLRLHKQQRPCEKQALRLISLRAEIQNLIFPIPWIPNTVILRIRRA